MKRLIPLLFITLFSSSGFAAVLWSQDFTAVPANFYNSSGFTRNAGNTYSCAFANNIYYTSSSNAYLETNTINVPQGKGLKFSFDSRRVNASAGSIQIYYLISGSCTFSTGSVTDNGWVLWGTITPATSAAANSGCTNQNLTLESYVCGGQNIAVVMFFPSATSTNWISLDNLLIEDTGPTTVAVPNITGATTYTENFTQSKWYGPVNTGNFATTGTVIPYHSYKNASSAITYLWSGGSGGTGNHSGNAGDYYAAFYTGFEFCNSGGSTQVITKELNTSGCAKPEVKFAYFAKYPCVAGAYSYTFDESYDLNAPQMFTSIGQGYTWVQQSVNYYFPDALWHFACYSVPSASNLKIKLSRGGSCSSPLEGIDNIKVFCRDCSISALTAGTISGESSPLPSTDYPYSITATAGAAYYKWMIRAINRTPPVMIEAACPNGSDPCIVSGQGTQNVVINFGSLSESYRVVCIPYDAAPGTLAAPSDACYAALSYFPTSPPLPIQLNYFKIIQLNEGIQLQWQTLTETNNDYFSIEQSQDGINFKEIATIDGAGNSNQELNYSYDVTHLHAGENYFRLTQYDFDGNRSSSKILAVINDSPEESISFNISYGKLELNSDKDILYPLSLHIFDIMGRLVFTANNIMTAAGSTISFGLPETTNGLYYLRLEGIGVDIKQKIYLR